MTPFLPISPGKGDSTEGGQFTCQSIHAPNTGRIPEGSQCSVPTPESLGTSKQLNRNGELEPGAPGLRISPRRIYIVEEGLTADRCAAARSLQVAAFLAIFQACLSINNNIYQLLWAYYVSRCVAYVNSLRTYYVLVCHLINRSLLLASSTVLSCLPSCSLLLLCRIFH